MNKDEIKLILLQTRTDIMKDHEYKVILEILDLKPSQLKQVDAYKWPVDPSIIKGYDGLISGGDGEHSVLGDYAFMKRINDLFSHCYDVNFPVLGICFGFQLMAQAYGGIVVDDEALKETGTVEVSLTKKGREDPIFKDVPESFLVNSFHNQSVVKLPDNAVNFCEGPKDIFYANKYKGKNIYGTQYHLELEVADIAARLQFYLDKYLDGGQDEYDKVMAAVQETKPVKQMLKNFVELI
jgi:GMP synthase (glutamine-hydrolysing)